jgi:hypothetical protein
MADIAVDTIYSSPRLSKNPGSIEVHNCTKCVEVEMQLKQVLEELSSAQLIIQMLKKESTLKDTTITSNQPADHKLHMADYWQVKSAKEEEGKMKIRNNEVIRSRNERIEISNCYAALATDDGIHESENQTNMCENLPSSTTSLPEINTKHNKQEHIKTANPQKEPRKSEDTRPNLKSKSVTP